MGFTFAALFTTSHYMRPGHGGLRAAYSTGWMSRTSCGLQDISRIRTTCFYFLSDITFWETEGSRRTSRSTRYGVFDREDVMVRRAEKWGFCTYIHLFLKSITLLFSAFTPLERRSSTYHIKYVSGAIDFLIEVEAWMRSRGRMFLWCGVPVICE